MEEDFRTFRSEELWRPSIFTVNGGYQGSIFDGLRLDDKSSLELPQSQAQETLFDGLADDFGLPPLEDVSLDASLEPGVTDDAQPEQVIGAFTPDQPSGIGEDDVWDFGRDPAPLDAGPHLHTWEAFQLQGQQSPSTRYLSEAGDLAFDAAIRHYEESAGVLAHDVVLRACCSLVLGRSSTFFQWDPTKKSFTQTLKQVALSGASLSSSQSLAVAFIQTGNAFRELNAFVTRTGSRDCTALVALKRSINAVLDQFERHICERIPLVRSLLQLQQLIEKPSPILMYLCKSARSLARLATDEEVISALSDEVTCLVESGHFLSNVMREMLAQVSMPWLQRLAEDVGLLPGLHARGQDSALGDPADVSDPSAKAGFLVPEDIRTISSVRRSIGLLRQHVPDHPLARNDGTFLGLHLLESSQAPRSDHVAQVAEKYKLDMSEAVDRYQDGLQSQHPTISEPLEGSAPLRNEGEDPFALPAFDESELPQDQDLEMASAVYNGFENALRTALEGTTDHLASGINHIDDSILTPLKPFIDVQAALVNNAVMGYIFRTYNLRAHLELHRSYHLFGNGDFVTRLTTALFSDDVQSAERKRGNIPTSETMGLRLGSRESQRWPPASSELRLTLLDVLTDSYTPQTQEDPQLPGGLSFAIRELTDAEIDRVMDPTSIYALDFLRLQYTPPAPLADIFPPSITQHYDSIFRTLLMHVRVLHASARLCSKNKPPHPSSTITNLHRFAWKARHFSTTLFSHFTDTVISQAWADFTSNLNALDPSLSSNNNPADLPTLTHLHTACLDEIRSKMFLRRKHDRVRAVVEQISGLVVRVSAQAVRGLEGEVGLVEQEGRFDGLCKEFGGLLEGLAGRVGRDVNGGSMSEGEAAGLLMERLSWGVKDGKGGGGNGD